MNTYSHLADATRPILDRSVAERISYIYRDHLIKFDQFNNVTTELQRLLHYPRQVRMPCMLLMGKTGMGKTKAVQAFLRHHGTASASVGGKGIHQQPIVFFQMPAEPSQGELFGKLLDALGAPISPSTKIRVLERTILNILRDVGTMLIIVDEFNNLNSTTARQRQIDINALKNLTNDSCIPIVAVGTLSAQLTIKYDDQMAHRFRPVVMEPFRAGRSLDEFVRTIVAHLPLQSPSDINTADFKKRLLDLTGGVTVNLLRLLSDAAVAAIQSGAERITVAGLSDVPAPLMSIPERRSTSTRHTSNELNSL